MPFRIPLAVFACAVLAGCVFNPPHLAGPVPAPMSAPMPAPVAAPAQAPVAGAAGIPQMTLPQMPVASVASAPAVAMTPDDPAPAPAAATGIAGLQERQPDLCGASNYRSSVGQPGRTIPNLELTRVYRVVEYRGIEPQDYDPNRIVFRLDASGNITKVDCG
ncbi:hypothetical protein [Paracoccus sp. (in: a-proteobacteria)]|uniref:hypothetical protein n=1 Tax=Paracoccus sp. TaxID=267 RepID=UPI0026DFAE65|nr:hypothetical protein [Paracoccus sp. (in: a-proteobacteria)]MDO5647680.1 hypothetical protein [Paracoccus sp. (in: a-proteobacteria)]